MAIRGLAEAKQKGPTGRRGFVVIAAVAAIFEATSSQWLLHGDSTEKIQLPIAQLLTSYG